MRRPHNARSTIRTMSCAPIRLPAPPPLALWRLSLAGEVSDRDRELLDDDERARAARFVFERDRRRFVAAHAGLRRLLGERVGVDPAALRFESGEFGKPRLRDEPGCTFSLSHSGDEALVALHDSGDIGVDLEALGSTRDIEGLARHCLTQVELVGFDATPEAERELAFLRAWTRKEACLKALGSGLQIAPSTVETGVDAAERRVRVDMPGGVCELEVRTLVPMPGWIAAVATLNVRPKEGMAALHPTL